MKDKSLKDVLPEEEYLKVLEENLNSTLGALKHEGYKDDGRLRELLIKVHKGELTYQEARKIIRGPLFYRNSDKKIYPINKKYSYIKDQFHLYEILSKYGWKKETCAPRLQRYWNENNKACGQCSITAFLVQDIFGGEVYGVKTKRGMHCFNKINDVIIDLTSEQFKGKNVITNYPLDNIQSKEEHFKKEEKYKRYLLLIENIKQK